MSASQYVQVRESQVRNSPSFLGKTLTTVFYGDRLSVLRKQGGWFKVETGKTKGWLHGSAVTSKKIALRPHAGDVSRTSSSDELALAGKGFNKQVEEQFRKRNAAISFELVDMMEADIISQETIEAFIKAGDLTPQGGAA